MQFAIIKDNKIVNVILADNLQIAQEITDNDFEVFDLEELQNSNSIIDNSDVNNSITIIPNLGMGWFLDTLTNNWCRPKPDGNYEWKPLTQNWWIWVEELQMWLLEIEYVGYTNGTWTPITVDEESSETT